jgi:molybdopterin synthase catalytic subunit
VFKITTDVLSLDEAYAAVRRDGAGAVVLFVGTVRDHHAGKKVVSISYSSFKEMAEKEFATIAAEMRARWTLGEIYIAHRTGPLKIGEASVIISVSSEHRAEAFEACRFAIEALKKMAPIWKEEFYDTGKAWISG